MVNCITAIVFKGSNKRV